MHVLKLPNEMKNDTLRSTFFNCGSSSSKLLRCLQDISSMDVLYLSNQRVPGLKKKLHTQPRATSFDLVKILVCEKSLKEDGVFSAGLLRERRFTAQDWPIITLIYSVYSVMTKIYLYKESDRDIYKEIRQSCVLTHTWQNSARQLWTHQSYRQKHTHQMSIQSGFCCSFLLYNAIILWVLDSWSGTFANYLSCRAQLLFQTWYAEIVFILKNNNYSNEHTI